MPNTMPFSLSAEDAAATATYLKDLSDRSSNLTAVAQSLFARCCLHDLSGSAFNLKGLGEEAGALGSRILNDPQPEQLGMDPVLLIEIYRRTRGSGTEPAGFRLLLERMAAELAAQPEETRRIGRVRFIASQLAALGFAIRPARPAREVEKMLRTPERWFTASAAEIAEIADHLLAGEEPLDRLSSRILSLIALAELRNYRVDLGCALLRVVFQLGERCQESEDALNFIALQRRRDGRYGFPNQMAESSGAGDDPHLKLYLPLTVNAVWLLSVEAASNWRQIAVSA